MMIHLITRSRSSGIVKVQIDLSSCALKTELKGAIWIDTFKLTSKKNSACFKIKVDNLYGDKPFFYFFFMLSKHLYWLPNSMLLILRYQVLVN